MVPSYHMSPLYEHVDHITDRIARDLHRATGIEFDVSVASQTERGTEVDLQLSLVPSVTDLTDLLRRHDAEYRTRLDLTAGEHGLVGCTFHRDGY